MRAPDGKRARDLCLGLSATDYRERRPAPFRVGSTTMYRWPGLGVGGKGFPCTTVRSSPVLPPRGPTIPTWDDTGAGWPGLKASFDIADMPPEKGLPPRGSVDLAFGLTLKLDIDLDLVGGSG